MIFLNNIRKGVKGMVKRSIITVEFSRIKEEDIQLYLKLKEFDKPGSIIKDILKGRLTLSILQEEQKNRHIKKICL